MLIRIRATTVDHGRLRAAADETSPPGSGCPSGWRSASADHDNPCSGKSLPVTSSRWARMSGRSGWVTGCSRRQGIGLGAYAEYICLSANPKTGAIATMSANLSYRGGRGRALRWRGGLAVPAEGERPERARSTWSTERGGELRHVRGPARQGPRGSRHRGGPCAEAGNAEAPIGADRVIDYFQEDFTDSPETYDVIFDVVRGAPVRTHGEVADEERVAAHGQSGLHADRCRARWASRGSKKRVSFAASGVDERRPSLPARPGRGGTAAPGHRPAVRARADGRGSPVRWEPSRSWGTSSSWSPSCGRDRQPPRGSNSSLNPTGQLAKVNLPDRYRSRDRAVDPPLPPSSAQSSAAGSWTLSHLEVTPLPPTMS